MVFDEIRYCPEVLITNPEQFRNLVFGVSIQRILQTVGNRWIEESAVTTGCPECNLLHFEQDDLSIGVACLSLNCRPETGEPAANDGQVRRAVPANGDWTGTGRGWLVQ